MYVRSVTLGPYPLQAAMPTVDLAQGRVHYRVAGPTGAWITPALTDAGVRRDTAEFLRAARPADLVDAATRLHRFTRPVLLLWGAADRFFTLALARRLEAVLPGARLVPVEGGRTFLPLDEPDRVAAEIDAERHAVADGLR